MKKYKYAKQSVDRSLIIKANKAKIFSPYMQGTDKIPIFIDSLLVEEVKYFF